jgi:hypothetical protein
MTSRNKPNQETPGRRSPPVNSHDHTRNSGPDPDQREPPEPPGALSAGGANGDRGGADFGTGPTRMAELETGSLDTGPLEGGMVDPEVLDIAGSLPRRTPRQPCNGSDGSRFKPASVGQFGQVG